jgi:alpha-1,2-glucosyltransferase
MLYLWAFIAFFSFPLLLPLVLAPIVRCFPSSRIKSLCQEYLIGKPDTSAPKITSALAFAAFGLAAVHFNTIVHPFTRADNRHYVFYVFRILLRHWAVKYLAVPVYFACAYVALQTLGSGPRNEAKSERKLKQSPSPANSPAYQPCQVSFILVWLATTALSVVSAPLVEPRYLIIPWIVWRLHVPALAASSRSQRAKEKGAYDMRLVLETIWHLAINVVTGYIFLYRGFTWESESGNVQRFMY